MKSRIILQYIYLTVIIERINSVTNINSEFSIGLITDIHYGHPYGLESNIIRLKAAVKYINKIRDEENLKLVGILGDIAWSSIEYIERAKNELDKLVIPYVPLVGNNDVNRWSGGDKAFHTVFKPQYELLSIILEGWEKTPLPLVEPGTTQELYLQNYAYDFHGLRIICCDWSSRVGKTRHLLLEHHAHLYNFEFGSWSFFTKQFITYANNTYNNTPRKLNSFLAFSHEAMHVSPGYPLLKFDILAFPVSQFNIITLFTKLYSQYFAYNFAGHYHFPWHEYVTKGKYQIICVNSLKPLIDAVKFIFYKPRIGMIRVIPKSDRFEYKFSILVVPMDDN